MPILSALAVRAALIHLLFGFTIGAILLSNKAVSLHPALWSMLPAHIDFLLFGWAAQLAMAVADWILPRHAQRPKRGSRGIAGTAFIFLNLGVLLVAISTWMPFNTSIRSIGRAFELLGVTAFIVIAWQRIATKQRQIS
jgi:hypothetical protein